VTRSNSKNKPLPVCNDVQLPVKLPLAAHHRSTHVGCHSDKQTISRLPDALHSDTRNSKLMLLVKAKLGFASTKMPSTRIPNCQRSHRLPSCMTTTTNALIDFSVNFGGLIRFFLVNFLIKAFSFRSLIFLSLFFHRLEIKPFCQRHGMKRSRLINAKQTALKKESMLLL
jgi:hypothetical protein